MRHPQKVGWRLYLAYATLGSGTLAAWNTLITTSDYFELQFPVRVQGHHALGTRGWARKSRLRIGHYRETKLISHKAGLSCGKALYHLLFARGPVHHGLCPAPAFAPPTALADSLRVWRHGCVHGACCGLGSSAVSEQQHLCWGAHLHCRVGLLGSNDCSGTMGRRGDGPTIVNARTGRGHGLVRIDGLHVAHPCQGGLAWYFGWNEDWRFADVWTDYRLVDNLSFALWVASWTSFFSEFRRAQEP